VRAYGNKRDLASMGANNTTMSYRSCGLGVMLCSSWGYTHSKAHKHFCL